ncbi:hypothetical protein [Demequina sp.]|uniref:hypothetical protein n=1 Tax=Demequina sp. TaxID=2050685 RepID=UPI0025B94DF7|nr:hypothetical protein [Demequina sp.]
METQGTRLAAARAALSAVESRMGADRKAAEGPALALDEALAPVLPRGLPRGQVVAVEGSTSLMLALASRASREGAWTAMVGMPNVGVLAAARRGMDLNRLALIPYPGAQAPATLSVCLDGMDIVMVGQGVALSDADRRRLAARARERGCVMVVAGPWPGAHVALTVERVRWRGLGSGEGRLRERDVTVAIAGRSAGSTRRVVLTLDVDDQRVGSREPTGRTVVEDRALGTGAA